MRPIPKNQWKRTRQEKISEINSVEHSCDDEDTNRYQQHWESLSLVNLLLRKENTTALQQNWKDELLPSQAGLDLAIELPEIHLAAAQVKIKNVTFKLAALLGRYFFSRKYSG